MTDHNTKRGADALARSYGQAAIETLAEIMADETTKKSDRIAAANALLDRGYGKATQAVIALPSKKAVAHQLASMSEDQLRQTLLEARQRRAALPAPGQVDSDPAPEPQSEHESQPWD